MDSPDMEKEDTLGSYPTLFKIWLVLLLPYRVVARICLENLVNSHSQYGLVKFEDMKVGISEDQHTEGTRSQFNSRSKRTSSIAISQGLEVWDWSVWTGCISYVTMKSEGKTSRQEGMYASVDWKSCRSRDLTNRKNNTIQVEALWHTQRLHIWHRIHEWESVDTAHLASSS